MNEKNNCKHLQKQVQTQMSKQYGEKTVKNREEPSGSRDRNQREKKDR